MKLATHWQPCQCHWKWWRVKVTLKAESSGGVNAIGIGQQSICIDVSNFSIAETKNMHVFWNVFMCSCSLGACQLDQITWCDCPPMALASNASWVVCPSWSGSHTHPMHFWGILVFTSNFRHKMQTGHSGWMWDRWIKRNGPSDNA